MPRIGLNDFVGTRCRMARLSDSRIFNGWFTSQTGRNIGVRVHTEASLNIGDEFRFEACGDTIAAVFNGRLKDIGQFDAMTEGRVEFLDDGGATLISARSVELVVQTTSEIRFTSSHEPVRFKVSNWPATINHQGLQFDATVVDIARRGVGLVTREVWEPGTIVQLEVTAPHGATRAKATIRYCRVVPDGNGEYRLGLEFGEMGRIDVRRWESEVRNSA